MTENLLRFIYADSEISLTKKELKALAKLDQIPMQEFFDLTSPRYHVEHCRFNNLNCIRSWRRVGRLMGYCIELSFGVFTLSFVL